ncbi:hypothetical protein BgiBS90_002988 [Biomphalaria glabrata]|nr:hypothetical protein BgiBS90_002988 [Biomphalaria glabrata]
MEGSFLGVEDIPGDLEGQAFLEQERIENDTGSGLVAVELMVDTVMQRCPSKLYREVCLRMLNNGEQSAREATAKLISDKTGFRQTLV